MAECTVQCQTLGRRVFLQGPRKVPGFLGDGKRKLVRVEELSNHPQIVRCVHMLGAPRLVLWRRVDAEFRRSSVKALHALEVNEHPARRVECADDVWPTDVAVCNPSAMKNLQGKKNATDRFFELRLVAWEAADPRSPHHDSTFFNVQNSVNKVLLKVQVGRIPSTSEQLVQWLEAFDAVWAEFLQKKEGG